MQRCGVSGVCVEVVVVLLMTDDSGKKGTLVEQHTVIEKRLVEDGEDEGDDDAHEEHGEEQPRPHGQYGRQRARCRRLLR